MIKYATLDDFNILKQHEHCISDDELVNSIHLKRVLIMTDDSGLTGWLRYNLFWDNTPFMNMLYILDDHRGKGNGTALVRFWEEQMLALGYESVMTSTLSNEQAQFFYRRLGYTDCGSLLLPGEALEIIFRKNLR